LGAPRVTYLAPPAGQQVWPGHHRLSSLVAATGPGRAPVWGVEGLAAAAAAGPAAIELSLSLVCWRKAVAALLVVHPAPDLGTSSAALCQQPAQSPQSTQQ
jgi:hypothetical protein